MAEEELQNALFPDLNNQGEEIDQLRQELEEKNRTYQELENQLKRLAADFENYRRRQAIEREELSKYASSKLLEGFLPTIDNFERAIQAGRSMQDPAKIQQGVELIYRHLADFLVKNGVKPLDCVGKPFDPNLHEAVSQVTTSEHADQTVLYELERGYLFFDRVLRYAKVQVAQNPEQSIEQTVSKEAESQETSAENKEEQHG